MLVSFEVIYGVLSQSNVPLAKFRRPVPDAPNAAGEAPAGVIIGRAPTQTAIFRAYGDASRRLPPRLFPAQVDAGVGLSSPLRDAATYKRRRRLHAPIPMRAYRRRRAQYDFGAGGKTQRAALLIS